jgi:hypothetical protein
MRVELTTGINEVEVEGGLKVKRRQGIDLNGLPRLSPIAGMEKRVTKCFHYDWKKFVYICLRSFTQLNFISLTE